MRLTRHATTLCAAAALFLFTGCDLGMDMDLDFGGAKKTETFEWSGAMAPGQTLEIKGVNGSIRTVAASGGEVRVHAEKSSRKDDPSEVRIEVVEHADGITLCAVYPGAGNSCEPGGDYKYKVKRNRVSVDFEVEVPEGVAFSGSTVNGSIKAEGLTAAAWGETVNGSVTLETTDIAAAKTVNGSIKAHLGANRFAEDLSFSAVNGSVTVYLPEDVNASVKASATNGKVRSDFPLDIPKRFHGGKASGDLGEGGALLEASVVNGSVKILEDSADA